MRPVIISAGLLAAFTSLSFAQQPSPGPSPQPEVQPSPESVPPSPAPYKPQPPDFNPYSGLPANPWDQAKNYWKYYFDTNDQCIYANGKPLCPGMAIQISDDVEIISGFPYNSRNVKKWGKWTDYPLYKDTLKIRKTPIWPDLFILFTHFGKDSCLYGDVQFTWPLGNDKTARLEGCMRQKYTGPELDNPWNILQYGNDDYIDPPYPPTYGGYYFRDALQHPVQGNGDLSREWDWRLWGHFQQHPNPAQFGPIDLPRIPQDPNYYNIYHANDPPQPLSPLFNLKGKGLWQRVQDHLDDNDRRFQEEREKARERYPNAPIDKKTGLIMLNTPVASNVGDGTKDNLPASNNYISSSGTGTDTTAATSPTSQKGADTDLTTEAIGQGTTPNTDGDSDSSTQPSNERQGTALKAQDVSTISTGTGSDTATNKNVNGGDSALQKPGTQVSALPFSDESATEIVSDTTNGNTPVNSNDGAMDFTKTSKKKLRRSPRDFGNSGPA